MRIPTDYEQRVYAGVLGKIIGVYLGRPFEGWDYAKIMAELGEVNYYVHEKRNVPLIVTDDDISGTFTFVRAMEDYGNTRNLTAEQIGQTWLNYLIEGRTVLWWGGLGNSTEHTAYLRLKKGIPAPRSGSIALNSKVVAEQIGAQIFIDGWAMIAPGDPDLAVELATKAASVSHDGEAIYGAQVVAALESMAFVENDLNKLLDKAVGYIPKDSVIYRMIADLRKLRKEEGDWRKAYEFMKANYGYDKYGGNCHMVPNHGLIILALLWGDDDFQKSLMIVNTCGWDTDCNSANVGCIMGIKLGLAGIDAGPDWRGPVADRLYLPTADGGSCISDALAVTYQLVNMGRRLAGQGAVAPKGGARFHFSLPGSVQGFINEDGPESRGTATIENPRGEGLAIHYKGLAPGRYARVATATFAPPEAAKMGGYSLFASPTLCSGQTVRVMMRGSAAGALTGGRRDAAAAVAPVGAPAALRARLYIRVYGDNDQLMRIYGPDVDVTGDPAEWQIPDTSARPIAEIGVELSAPRRADGTVHLDYLTWDGEPTLDLARPEGTGKMYEKSWVDACHSIWWGKPGEGARLMHNEGRGLLLYGTRQWRNYRVSGAVTPHMARAAGLAARAQGMKRYYALVLEAGCVKLVKELDGEKVLGQKSLAWEFTKTYKLAVEVAGNRIRAWVDEALLFDVTDNDGPLETGGIAMLCDEGRTAFGPIKVEGV